jgi:hypothetical protein
VGGIAGGAALGAGFYHFARRSNGVNGTTGTLGATLVGAALGTAGGALIGAFVDVVLRRH